MTPASSRRALTGLLLVLLLLLLAAGLGGLHPARLADPFERTLLFDVRLPRLLLAASAGALLASAGAVVQARFNNALAEPGLLGISGGAALAAATALYTGQPAGIVTLCAFAGSAIGLALIRLLAREGASPARLVLTGVALNALSGSLLTLLITTLPDGSLRTVTFWLMGSFADADWARTRPVLLACLPLLWVMQREWRLLDAFQLGDTCAFHLGFSPGRDGWRVSLFAALAAGLVVATCGMVGFIGLMAPHLARQLGAGNNRHRLVLAPLLGAVLSLAADRLAATLLYPAELPVGVITSLAGAPFFLWLLWRSERHA